MLHALSILHQQKSHHLSLILSASGGRLVNKHSCRTGHFPDIKLSIQENKMQVTCEQAALLPSQQHVWCIKP